MDLNEWLRRCPVIAILRGLKPEEAASICPREVVGDKCVNPRVEVRKAIGPVRPHAQSPSTRVTS